MFCSYAILELSEARSADKKVVESHNKGKREKMESIEVRTVNLTDLAKVVKEGQLDSSLKDLVTPQEAVAFEAYADEYQEGERFFNKGI